MLFLAKKTNPLCNLTNLQLEDTKLGNEAPRSPESIRDGVFRRHSNKT
jgi:hypothetical protein